MSRFGVAALLVFLSGSVVVASDNEIVVDNEIPNDQILKTVEIAGYRAFPDQILMLAAKPEETAWIPVNYVYDTAKNINTVKAALIKNWASVDAAPIDSVINELKIWKKVSMKGGYENLWQEKPLLVKDEKVFVGTSFDAKLISFVWDTEFFKEGKFPRKKFHLGGKEIDVVMLEDNAGKSFLRSYANIKAIDVKIPSDVAKEFLKHSKGITQYAKLQNVSKIPLGQITFGLPLFHSYLDMKLEVQDHILRKYDVYYAEFAFSDRRSFNEKLEEITFSINLPGDAIAIDLVPMSFGVEQKISETRSAPEVAVSVRGAKVALGKLFGQTISFTAIKPVIVGKGLQENSIAWSLRGDAAEPGAKKFIAVIGVPIGMRSIPVELSAYAKVDRYFGLQGDIAVTEVVKRSINLPRTR